MEVRIAEASPDDMDRVLAIERAAFPAPDVAELVSDLMDDPTAQPMLSLLAWEGDYAVGHALFTPARLTGHANLSVSILAPLAVVPDAQGRGIGGALIETGVDRLAQSGVDLVFVLGHPDYYPRHGFVPAMPLGLRAPYPVNPEEAWMVRQLSVGVAQGAEGTVECAEALSRPEHWRE